MAQNQHCRFYEEKYPEIDSFVMVNVKQVSNNLICPKELPLTNFRSPKWVPTLSF